MNDAAQTEPAREQTVMEPEVWLRTEAWTVRRPLAAALVCGAGISVLIIIQAKVLAAACHSLIISGAYSESMHCLM